MATSTWTESDTKRAEQFWADYQKQHDVSHLQGKAVGIDPVSGRIWFGESASDISLQMEALDAYTPLFILRVGQDHYFSKGRRQ